MLSVDYRMVSILQRGAGENVAENWDAMPEAELEKRLTERQRRFALEYLRNGGNGTAAAISAGYSPKSAHVQASRMLRDDKVTAYRRAQARVLYKALGLTPEKIGLETYSVYQRCMQAEEHLSWDADAHAYVPDGMYVFDSRGALKALELLGKLAGAYTEKIEISAPKEENWDLRQMLTAAQGVVNGAAGGSDPAPGGAAADQ